jgi:divalent metal cation (Fe/Co/Zn/Cd) transporter
MCKFGRNNVIVWFPQDHYFDVVTNVVGLAAAVLGDRFYWWIDPVGAIVLAVYTITKLVWNSLGKCRFALLVLITTLELGM